MIESEIKKKITNRHKTIKSDRTLEKISTEIFNSLESILKSYPNLKLLKQDYNDNYSSSFWNGYEIKGELFYDIPPEPPLTKSGCIKVSIFAGYSSSDGDKTCDYYTAMSIHFLGNPKTGSEIVNKLTTKFKSFK